MEDRALSPDSIEQADAVMRRPSPTIEQLMSGVEPITSWNDLNVPGLSDEEPEAFATALAEDE